MSPKTYKNILKITVMNQIKIGINGNEFHSDHITLADLEARVHQLQEAPRTMLRFYINATPNRIDGTTTESLSSLVKHYRSEVEFYQNVLRQIDKAKEEQE